jgi:MarR family transcriptional regulator, organic hydroperoxide resistance regulator
MRNEMQIVEDWELLAQFAQTYRSLSDAFMDEINMHRSQGMLLCKLSAQDGVTQSELAQQLSVQGATITDMLQRIEEAGLVSRRRDPDDNRLVRVYLTELGRERERAIAEQFMKMESAIFADINEADRETMRNLLRRLMHNMNVRR